MAYNYSLLSKYCELRIISNSKILTSNCLSIYSIIGVNAFLLSIASPKPGVSTTVNLSYFASFYLIFSVKCKQLEFIEQKKTEKNENCAP